MIQNHFWVYFSKMLKKKSVIQTILAKWITKNHNTVMGKNRHWLMHERVLYWKITCDKNIWHWINPVWLYVLINKKWPIPIPKPLCVCVCSKLVTLHKKTNWIMLTPHCVKISEIFIYDAFKIIETSVFKYFWGKNLFWVAC